MRFGDINEEGSKIAELKNNKRAYHLLAESESILEFEIKIPPNANII